MKTQELLEKVQGYTRIEDMQKELNVNRARAIYLIHRLRKRGYVSTYYGGNGKRVYYISLRNALGGTSYTEIINKCALTPLMSFNEKRFYGRVPTIEETLIYALQKKRVRYIIASLMLYKKIKDWSCLYRLAKRHGLVRQIAALYDIARLVIPKLQRMPLRFNNLGRPKKDEPFVYIIDKFYSDNFKDIEEKWRVYIPLNWADLHDYRGFFT